MALDPENLTVAPSAPPTHPHRKSLTERVDDALVQILDGESVEGIIGRLSESEQELFNELVQGIRSGRIRDLDAFNDIWRVDYIHRPPSIHEFVTEERWLGNTLKTTETNPGLYPSWKKILTSDFDLDSRLHNVVITGALGIGKTFSMCAIFLYRLALARLLRNPQNFFGLNVGSKIVYAILSVSRSVVRQTAWHDVVNAMSHSSFFIEECHFDPDKKYADNNIDLGNNIDLIAGSKGWHVIGQNVMGVCLDEGNWRIESNPDEKAYVLYDEVRTRIKNRFQKFSGYLPAISILSSSARDETSFTERIISEIIKVGDPSTETVYRMAVYQAKRHLLTLDGRWFKVAHGLKNIEPYILKGWYDENGNLLNDEKNVENAPPGASVELVPHDYIESFVRNCRTALQNFSGISTGGTMKLFPSTINLEKAIELGEAEGLKNPSKLGKLPISMEDNLNIWDFLIHQNFLTRKHSRTVPLRHPDAFRFAHIDLATTSMAGVSICHLAGQQLIRDIRDGQPYDEYRLIVEYDFILTIVSGQRRPISIEKIQRFFFWLRSECNYNFGLVTADMFQSELPLQMMETRGFNVKKLSVDKTKAPYYQWRQGFEESRIRMYRQEQLLYEAERLLDLASPGKGKIDHPASGSKDTTDSASGAYFNAISEATEMGATLPVSHQSLFTDTQMENTEDAPINMDPYVLMKQRGAPPTDDTFYDA